ncbi:SIR2 family protein [Rhizobium leguminosarum]|uniref:SIR2 family protein n=1 Tax=Rhizobium leguminosarum TaxID=384 RepID=UPI001038DE01|nr:SIR2 family protein [Rhizobium leguminosarum]TBZ79685.1 SIR2 family protein [Rhizobium leguminosarum bv. viciae]TBZ97047.1 SIR2 family protein [Rhizobium leguminosarum bv. viciae]
MKVRSIQTSGAWIEIADDSGNTAADPGSSEARRVLSSAVRSQNLAVLAGLGTSLCVTKNSVRLAPTMLDLLARAMKRFSEIDVARNKADGHHWSDFETLSNVPKSCKDLEYFMSRATVAAGFLAPDEAGRIESYVTEAEEVIRSAVDFMEDDVDLGVHESFLRRVARRSSRRSRTKLFTTNYDLCFEMAARRSGFVVIDGFAFGNDARFDSAQFNYDVVRRSVTEERSDYIENLFHLHKLHGSVDWERQAGNSYISRKPGTRKPLLIYPRSDKYELAFSQPYIEMMGVFQSFVRVPSTTLLVIGFGFNDKHIAEPILAAVRGNLGLDIVIVSPDVETASGKGGNSYLGELLQLIDGGDGRISLIAAKFEEIIKLIPDVVSETELERHNQRLRNLGKSNA